MEKLTTSQELKILRELKNKSFMATGSSRAVWKLDDYLVVKVALDSAGKRQNENEVRAFRALGETLLAKITAFGKNIIIAEKINLTIDYERKENIEKSESVIRALDQMFGETLDNDQVGIRPSTNEIVSYDYGFNTKKFKDFRLLIGGMRRYIDEYGVKGVLEKVEKNILEEILQP
jgi:hypothetical protein